MINYVKNIFIMLFDDEVSRLSSEICEQRVIKKDLELRLSIALENVNSLIMTNELNREDAEKHIDYIEGYKKEVSKVRVLEKRIELAKKQRRSYRQNARFARKEINVLRRVARG